MKRGFTLTDESGEDVLAPKVTPLQSRLLKVAQGLQDGRVLSIGAAITKIGGGSCTIRMLLGRPEFEQYRLYVNRKLYLCNAETKRRHDESKG